MYHLNGLPVVGLPEVDCLYITSGERYVGKMNRTISGRPCQPWKNQFPHSHPYSDITAFNDYALYDNATIDDVSNFCRNPSIDELYDEAPWCYTMDESMLREYCDITQCTSETNLTCLITCSKHILLILLCIYNSIQTQNITK